MSEERIVVEFTTQGLPETQQDIDNLQNNAVGGFTELNSQLELFTSALAGLQGVAGALYGSLIDSNERLNQELLKSQVALASTLEIYKGSTQVTDITEKITASQGALRDSLKQIEKDTTELVGVTTEQVNGIFQILLQNASSFIGQSKEFSNPIDAATNATKGWAAALGTLGLPLEQANQEIRSILQGDVNNPDSVIAKTLAISKEQYNQWVANGELIDRINEKLAVYVEGNKLASQSVGAITSNIQSFFEDTARMAGEPLLAPIVAALNDVYQLLNNNRALIEELAQENVQDLVDLFDTLRKTVAGVGDSLNISPEGFLKGGSEIIGNLIKAAEGLIKVGGTILEIFGPQLTTAFGNAFAVINLSLEGIGKLAEVLNVAGQAFAGFLKAANLGGALDLGKVFDNAQASVAKLTGEYAQATEATETYRDITATLTAQAEKIASSGNASSAMVKGQIDALNEQKESLKGLKTYREEDKASVEAQIAAVDKSIKALEGLKTAQDELTFKAPKLAELGTMMELLGKNAESALATLGREGGGKKEVFEEAAKSLTELTQKQVEYGQITAKEGIARLSEVVSNTKLELETREEALAAMKALEEEFTQFKVGQLDRQAEAVERSVKTGALSAIEGAKASGEIAAKQSQIQIDSIDSQIKKAEELGQSTAKLAAEREELVSKQADTELATIEKVGQLREKDQEEAYQKAVSTAEQAETERLIALEKGLAAKKVSETQYNQQTLESTKQRIAAELEAETANQAQLEALLAGAGTADQREEIENKIADSKKKTMDLQLEATKAEVQGQKDVVAAQERAAEEAKKVLGKRLDAVRDSYKKSVDTADLAEGAVTVGLKKQLADRQITQEQYDKKVSDTTKTRLTAELQANSEQLKKLEAIAASSKGNKEANDAVTEAKKRQIDITQQLLDLDISANKQSAEAVKKANAEKVAAIEKTYAASTGKAQEAEDIANQALKKGLLDRSLNQEQYDNRVLESRRTRLQAEVAAEQEAITKLSSISVGGKEQEEIQNKITEAKNRSRKATSELLDIELNAKDKIVDAYKTQLNEKLKGISIEYDEREAAIRKNEKQDSQSQVKLAQLSIDRIRAQMAAEEDAANKLASLGDSKGAAEKKLELRKLAINLIDAEIKAEESLQDVLKNELDILKKRLELKKGTKEVSLLEEELKLAEAVKNGTVTKEQAEKRKLEIARARIVAELELLQGLEGKGEESDRQKNQQDQLKARIQLAEIDKQINEVGKEDVKTKQEATKTVKETKKEETAVVDVLKQQQDALKRNTDSRLAALDLQKQALTQIAALSDLEAQSVARVGELRASQGGLLSAQLAGLESGLGNELKLVNAALASRTKLSEVEKKLGTDTKLTAEQRVELEKEAVALRAQLGALGEEGGKTELQLIEQRMAAEQRQIQVKREQMVLSQEMATIEHANQEQAIKLDKVRADFKAREMELEARKLDIQARQLEAQANLTKDAAEAAALREQAAGVKEQAENTKELSEAQVKSAEEEARIRQQLLDNQKSISEFQAQAQEKALDTEQKLLNSQQAYERSLKGLKPKVDISTVDEFANKLRDIKGVVRQIATVEMPTLKLTPGNLNVSVKDDRTVAPLNALNKAARTQTDHLASVKSSVAPLAGKMEQVTRAIKNLEVGGGSTDTTVKNQITVNVSGGAPKPTVTTQNLINQRKKEKGC